MTVTGTPISGVYEAVSPVVVDDRGRFSRLFCVNAFAQAHGQRQIPQINLSLTRKIGALRGLHFQRPPSAEGKWIRCLRGRVFDVAVDLRQGSTTFLRWHAITLSGEAMNQIFIPEGCAHGFQVLEPDSELLYLHTASYTPRDEGGLRFDDPRLSIPWPLPISDVSDRDRNHPLIGDNFEGIAL